jgi:hypothetical protein
MLAAEQGKGLLAELIDLKLRLPFLFLQVRNVRRGHRVRKIPTRKRQPGHTTYSNDRDLNPTCRDIHALLARYDPR